MNHVRRIALSSLAALCFTLAAGSALAHERPSFPMTKEAFKSLFQERQAHARERLEAKAAKLPDAQAAALRQRFEARTALAQIEVDKATADGTVTREEAKAVRRAWHPHRKHAHGDGDFAHRHGKRGERDHHERKDNERESE